MSLVADQLIFSMARQLRDGGVVATGVASPLALLAIGLAKATHAPRLTYLSCVGAIDPNIRLFSSSEDSVLLAGKRASLSIAELFDHARRGRIDTVFFGAAEVDEGGRTNTSSAGPHAKLPGVAGAATLRRWVKNPVLVVPRQTKRNLVKQVHFATTEDTRPTTLLTDLGRFEMGAARPTLVSCRSQVTAAQVAERTGFDFDVATTLALDPEPDAAAREALVRLDPDNYRGTLVG